MFRLVQVSKIARWPVLNFCMSWRWSPCSKSFCATNGLMRWCGHWSRRPAIKFSGFVPPGRKKKTWGRVFSHFIAISYCNMWLVIWCGRTAAAFGWCKAPDSSQDPISVRVPSGSQRPSGQPQICVAHCASEVLIFIVFYCVVVLALMMLRYLGWGLIAVRHWLKLYYPQWQMLNVDVFTDLCKACHRPVHNVDAKRGRVHRPVHNQFAYAFGSAVVNPVKTLERLWFFS